MSAMPPAAPSEGKEDQRSRSLSAINQDMDEGRLMFAVPKKGRLFEKVKQLLKGVGLEYHRPTRLDLARCAGMPVSLVFLPAADIANYVGKGDCDLGITGIDIIRESGMWDTVKLEKELGFGKCTLSLLTPAKQKIQDAKTLAGKRIVTSFPTLTAEFFSELCPDAPPSITFVSGSVEVACSLGLADAVVDLVETGTTMRAAGLEKTPGGEVLKTQTVLISNPRTPHSGMVKKLVARVEGYLTAQKFVLMAYNVPVARMPEALLITPGKRSPSILPLEDPDWKAVSALVSRKEVSDIMDRLIDVGATDILVTQLVNCRFGAVQSGPSTPR